MVVLASNKNIIPPTPQKKELLKMFFIETIMIINKIRITAVEVIIKTILPFTEANKELVSLR